VVEIFVITKFLPKVSLLVMYILGKYYLWKEVIRIMLKKFSFAILFAMILVGVSVTSPAEAAVKVRNNGAFSLNKVKLSSQVTSNTVQQNYAFVGNGVEVLAETGDNDAKCNVGGSSDTTSGAANTTIDISTVVNSNTDLSDPCGCVQPPSDSCDCAQNTSGADITISGNGAFSGNVVSVHSGSSTTVMQSNVANIVNAVSVSSETGDNDSFGNVGTGSATTTGRATANVSIFNMANSNYAGM
jgi:hypothetical protein